MSKLKVFSTNYDGSRERIVAAPSQKEAARLIGTTLYDFRNFGHETGNKADIERAMREPGVVWERPYRLGAEWRRVEPRR